MGSLHGYKNHTYTKPNQQDSLQAGPLSPFFLNLAISLIFSPFIDLANATNILFPVNPTKLCCCHHPIRIFSIPLNNYSFTNPTKVTLDPLSIRKKIPGKRRQKFKLKTRPGLSARPKFQILPADQKLSKVEFKLFLNKQNNNNISFAQFGMYGKMYCTNLYGVL